MLNRKKLLVIVLLCLSMDITIVNAATENGLDTAKIEKLTGRKGTFDKKENVFKVSMPRKDIQTTVGETKMTPPMGLTAWAAFTKAGDSTMVMGDMVLLEDQVNPVMSVALDNGLEVTALHNHFLWDSPKVMFMHIGGMGDEEKLADAVGKVFAEIEKTATIKSDVRKIKLEPSQTSLDPNKIDRIFGAKGQLSDGVYKITFGRTTKMGEHEVGNAMGVNTWAAFIGSDEQAVVDGDFAMYESEVQTVLKTLRHAGINIVAIHNHMIMEQPRVIFLHFWGVGKTTDLVKGLKAALDTQKNSDYQSKDKHEEEMVIDFDKYELGKTPDGFSTAVTNGGPPGKWEIVDAGGKKVLAQTNADEADGRFPLCVYNKVSIKDVEVSVDFMAVSGKLDQAAGLVARYKDKDNYYITRANALEDNVRFYKVEGGQRKQIASANLKVAGGTWHNLKLEIEGTHQKVFYDSKLVIDSNDATFQDVGKVGLWTKADSVTYFNNLTIKTEK